MTPEAVAFVRDLLIPALESGEYKQARGSLRQKDGYCCLGVACDLAMKHGILDDSWEFHEATNWYSLKHLSEKTLLPLRLRGFLGWDVLGTRVTIDGVESHLTGHNDQGVPFPTIAQALREYIAQFEEVAQ